jgi:hypothetical protein
LLSRAARLWRVWGMLVPLAFAVACDQPLDGTTGRRARVEVVGGDNQMGFERNRLDAPLAVRVVDAATGSPRRGVPVRFALTVGAEDGAWLTDTLAVSDRAGVARSELTPGDAHGDSVVVRAYVRAAGSVSFRVSVRPSPQISGASSGTIRGGDTLALFGSGLALASGSGTVRFGEVQAAPLSVSDSLVRVIVPPCLADGDVPIVIARGVARSTGITVRSVFRATHLSLAPLEGRALRADQLGDCLVLDGTGRLLVIGHVEDGGETPASFVVRVGAAGGTAAALEAAGAPFTERREATPIAFERVLRAREAALSASVGGAQAPIAAARGPATIPPVGSLRHFRVIASMDAARFANATTRLRYAGANVIVWVDTTASVSDAILQPLARLFDEELYSLDEHAFGAPSDVDGNGRVHVVLTPVVNALTAANQCTLSGFVGGYFSAHDLYPGAANSNGGEVFYGFVPDASGRFGCVHSEVEFQRVIRTAFVHELQHVINYNQHVLLRGGPEETVWLNEGMSHIAEELASRIYERRYPAPSGRTMPDQLFPDSSAGFMLFNMINAYLFLRQPWANSLTHFQQAGTIEERGGMWMFLRWLADQYGDDILRRLVQTSLRGKANIEDKTGDTFSALAGDFAIAAFADSLPGVPRAAVPSRWQFQSRNWRSMFDRLRVISNFPPFPIDPMEIPLNGFVTGGLRVGGLVYLTLPLPSDGSGTVLRFVRADGAPWGTTVTPQVMVFRLP